MGIIMKRFIKELRLETGLTQKEFAGRYGIPLSTLRKWEQGDSFPADYIVSLIERTIPAFNDKYELIDNKYYLDRVGKRVSDKLGNWISFSEEIEGVMDCNLPVYFDELFDDFYTVQNKLNRDLRLDKVEKIKWR